MLTSTDLSVYLMLRHTFPRVMSSDQQTFMQYERTDLHGHISSACFWFQSPSPDRDEPCCIDLVLSFDYPVVNGYFFAACVVLFACMRL